MIKIHFYSAKWYLPLGTLIKTKTNSRFSHCAIELPHDNIIRHSRIGSGVMHDLIHYNKPTKTLFLPFDEKSKKGKNFIKLLDSKEGCGYDYLALFFGCWGKKIHDKDRYLCSEFCSLYITEYLNIVPDIKTIFVPKDLYLFLRGYIKGYNQIKNHADNEG